MGIPVDLDWDTVLASIGDLLGNPLVIAGVAASLALRFAPRIMRAVKSATSGR